MMQTWLLACLAAVLLGLAGGAAAQQGDPVDRIVAVVNDDVILASELSQEVVAIGQQLRASGTPMPSRDVLEKQVLERLILTRLQVQAADRAGMRVDEAALNNALQNIARQNNVTLAQFRDILERDGFSFVSFRDRVRSQMLITQLQQRQVASRVNVPEREVDNFLANQALRGQNDPEVLVAQILIALPDGASPEDIEQGRQRGNEVLAKLAEGEDFAELAVRYSDGRNALDGGEIGWKKPSELPRAFVEAIDGLADGEHSGLVRTGVGLHIIRVLKRRADERVLIEQTHARHILIRPGELASEDEVIKRLEQLRERIVQGDDFGALARSHSDDRSSALRGGDLGWLSPGDTVPNFERQMDLLDAGEVSQAFRTQFGWHIVQVIERRKHDGTEAVQRAQAREAIRKRKGEEELQTWLRQLRDEAYVELRLDRPY